MMRSRGLLFTCLAFKGHGRHMQISNEHVGSLSASVRVPLQATGVTHTRRQAGVKWATHPLETLVSLLFTCDPKAMFNLPHVAMCIPSGKVLLANSKVLASGKMAETEEVVAEFTESVDGKWIAAGTTTGSTAASRGGRGRRSGHDDEVLADPKAAAAKHAGGLRAFAVRDAEGFAVPVVDIGVNLGKVSYANAELQLRRAACAGVTRCIATGTTISGSMKSLELCRRLQEQPQGNEVAELFCTAGIHPHYAAGAPGGPGKLARELRKLYEDPLCVSIGECGLDYDRMRSPRDIQLAVFAEQARLAAELDAPIFCHERDLDTGPLLGSHDDLCQVVEEAGLRPERVCVHCYTGSAEHLVDYVKRGYMIGLTGFVGMHKRGAHLREALASGALPLSRLMVETDAPYMKPDKQYLTKEIGLQRQNEPCVTPAVVRAVAEVLGKSESEVAEVTTANALQFFGLA